MNKKLSDEFASLLTNIKAKGLLDLLSVNLFTQLISFGSLLLVVKFLSPEEYGEIKIIQSYTVFFIILAGFGFNTALLKLCSENRSDEEKEGILRLVVIRVGISSLISMVILFIFSSFGIITSSRNLSTWLIFYSLSIPFQVLAGVFLAYLQAKKRIREMARLQALIKILSVIIIIICTWIWGFKGFIIASVFAFAVSILPLIRVTGISFLNNRLLHIPLGIYNYAIYSFLANGMNQIWQLSDIFILDHFSQNRISIGFYSLALLFITAANQVTGSVQTIATPYFSENAGNGKWFKNKLIQYQMRLSLLSIFVAICVYSLARIFIPLIYGTEYIESLQLLAILLLRFVVWSSYALIGAALVGLGMMKFNFIVLTIITPLCFFFSYSLLRTHGITGVAWAQVITALIMFLLEISAVIFAYQKLFKKRDIQELSLPPEE